MRTVMTSAAIAIALALAVVVLGTPALRAQGQEGPSLLPPGEPGTPLVVEGRILGPSGPAAKAALYVYQTDARGYYSGEVNDDNRNPRLKARFATDDAGRFRFRTIMPGQYPRSGPPAHIHLEVTPAGKAMEQFELVFEGDTRMTDGIRADAKAGKFYAICTPATGAGGAKRCTDVSFTVH
jgi:protocatechuate 3,4-dioxygenase beta subunit